MTGRNVRSVKRALDESLRGVELDQVDQAALALAKRYALRIDENSGELGKLGPLLLDSLRDLRMTPKSRAAVMKGSGDDSGQRSKWDELEQRRVARLDGSAAGDTSTS